ncbi:MAG: hypothetical protein NZ956_00925 [Candidatus Caldarchaeum sp.]|nr:hypothetical protein [Candidatus Caldarchaeum sp.]
MADELERVFEDLRAADKKVDEIEQTALAMKRALVETAVREAEKRRQLILEEARAWQSRVYAEEVANAEEQAKKLMAEGVLAVEKVRRRAEKVRPRAMELVEEALFGRRRQRE